MKNYSKIILSILIQLQICNGYCSGICSDSLSGKLNYNKAIKNLYETVNYDSAIYYLDAAKAICIQFGNQEDLCKCYTHEAYLYLNLGEYNKALKILQKAETIAKQNNFN
ncbi:MAG: tetratricopeptide repeat protein [Bacteroidia bacterium]|nr:tetratricopeptide repeat protein [Bacteroidia bacterium]